MDRIPFLLMTLTSRWASGIAGWAIASTIIWYLFPIVPALQPPVRRIAAIVVLLVICLGVNFVLSWRKRRRAHKLAAAMAGEGRGAQETEADAAEEVTRLRERMKQALLRLRRRGGSQNLYEQPWYVLIGPPGSGKTTALLKSGLHFPLAEDAEDPAIGGIGGTRLCDWWFADEAVLIDTAGRYTTQDSDAAVDRAGWHGFLDLLRRTRPRQPLNGVIAVFSLVDLATAAPSDIAAHARSVRLRINELTERLQVRVPVYVMFSKADQLRGFDAYFDDLDAAKRAQVWGMTFPLETGVEAFGREFRLLLNRLEERLVERLQAEPTVERRALINGFPLQVASLEQPLTDFLKQAFAGSRLDPAPFLRGVYMTSATQEGTPIDRLIGMLAHSFGIDQKRAPSLRPASGRSYFVTRLLREVVLGEALLVSSRSSRARRRRILRIVGFSAVGLATVACAVLLWRADMANRVAVAQADEALAAYRQILSGLRLDPVTDDDLPHVVPLLDAAAALPHGGDGWAPNVLGLSQQAKLAQTDRLIYERALQRVLLPRLVWRLEQQMRGRFNDPDFLYEATRVYLMLGGAGPLDAKLVHAWMAADWQVRFPGALNAALRTKLLAHLDAMLATPLPPLMLDGALVEAARATFSRVSLAERVYSRMRADADAQSLPDWTPAEALGSSSVEMFTRPSGHKLTEGIPGFFTSAGYQRVMLHDLAATTRAVAGESWVLGHAEQIPTEGPEVAALEQSVVALYAADAQKHWDDLLGDLALAPFANRDAAIQGLYVLSSPQSPMRDLLAAIARELRLDAQPPNAPGAPPPAEARDASLKKLLAVAPPATAAETKAAPAALQGFDAHFQPLTDLAGGGNGKALDQMLHLVNALQQELAAATPGNPTLPATLQGGGDPVQLLLAEAGRQPVPLSTWLRQIAASGNTMLGSAVHDAASAAFADQDGPGRACRSLVDGHYPFDQASSQDAPIDDFARVFAPGGQLDSYFQTQIKPFVDTRATVWRVHALGGVNAPVDAATLASFQRAAAIRDAFFPLGGNQPQLRFTLQPGAGTGSASPVLMLGNTSTGTGDGLVTSFVWPGADGMTNATLRFDAAPGAAPALQESGPWALFRLFQAAQIAPGGGQESFRVAFNLGGQAASFTLRAGSSHTPFGQHLLAGFRCPVIK
jgi:type VI secretion system protein ImpL